MTSSLATPKQRLPEWLRRRLPESSAEKTHDILGRNRLTTVCEEAKCPNRSECYSHGTATFMILGDTCTRRCGFCSVKTGKPGVLEADEPERVAMAVKEMKLTYVVITSVARDDLKDEGSLQFAETIRRVKELNPGIQVEVLTPDFHARREFIEKIVNAGPNVYNHNLETVARLQRKIRPQAAYDRSLECLRIVKKINSGIYTKSGLMLGLGETDEEVFQSAKDLREAGCDILTLGQYLKPAKEQLDVVEFIHPEIFTRWEKDLKPLGFRNVFSGPYVRSSYHAGETFLNAGHKEPTEIHN